MKKSNSNTSTSRDSLHPSAGRILDYFDIRSESFRKALNAAVSHFAVQGIHDLRLEIDRIRALYAVIDYAAPPFAQRPDPSVFNDLYPAAGALRAVDIRQAITLRWLQTLDLSAYFNRLKEEELFLRTAFTDAASEFPFAALSGTRSLINSVLAIHRKSPPRKRILKKISKLADELHDLMADKHTGEESLIAILESAQSLRYETDAFQACFDDAVWAAEISLRLEAACDSLGERRVLLMTHRSVSEFLEEGPQNGFADITAYPNFLDALMRQAGQSLRAYKRSQKPLLKSLKSLAENP